MLYPAELWARMAFVLAEAALAGNFFSERSDQLLYYVIVGEAWQFSATGRDH